MSPRAIGIGIVIALVLAAVGATWLFWVQNSARVVMLSLNLGVVKLALQEPLPVPVLMGSCLAIGFVVGVICVVALRLGGGRRRTPSYDYDGVTPDRV